MTRLAGIIAVALPITVALLIAVGWSSESSNARSNSARHTCSAPCVITFPGRRMAEDQSCFDYRGDGTAYVWRDGNAECDTYPSGKARPHR